MDATTSKNSEKEKNNNLVSLDTDKSPLKPSNEFNTHAEHKKQLLENILKKTELYSHFVINKIATDQSNKKGKKGKKAAKQKSGGQCPESNKVATREIFQYSQTPEFISGEMRDYQIKGLNWIISLYENGLNGILADEMGLGKTLQIISFLGHLKHQDANLGPHLIVVPNSTLQNWANEFKKWCPSLKVFIYYGVRDERLSVLKKKLLSQKWEVCVTTYELCYIDISFLRKIKWQYLIIDEGHRIKNEKTRLATSIRTLKTLNRFLLTGTPLQNNLHELWALLNFLLPDIFTDSEDFDKWFDTAACLNDNNLVERIHTILKPLMLRRIKSCVEKDLLPKKELKIFVKSSEMQMQWYRKILEHDIDVINNQGFVSKMRLNYLFMHLRKCAIHPYLFPGAEPPPMETDERLIKNSGKLAFLDKLLPKLQKQKSRVLIFSQMVRFLDILEDYLIYRNYTFCRLDGNYRNKDRTEQIDNFNEKNSDKFIFMLSTRAGGLGINLTGADTVIMYDSDWNPQMDLQAIDRAHRIGQTKQVVVYRLITKGSVEEKIIERAEMKLRLDQIVIQQRQNLDEKNSYHKWLKDTIDFTAKNLLTNSYTAEEYKDEDIDVILRESRILSKRFDKKFEGLNEATLLSEFDVTDTEKFNDKTPNYDKKISDQSENKENGLRLRPRIHHYIIDNCYRFYPKESFTVLYNNKHSTTGTALTERTERSRMEDKGFPNWSCSEIENFLHANVMFGATDYDEIAEYIKSKTVADVESYAKVFWSRFKELSGTNPIIEQIRQNQEEIANWNDLKSSFVKKMSQLEDPYAQLEIDYSNIHSPVGFSKEIDKLILCKYLELMNNKDPFHEIACYLRSRDDISADVKLKLKKDAVKKHCKNILKNCFNSGMSIEKNNVKLKFNIETSPNYVRAEKRKVLHNSVENEVTIKSKLAKLE